MKIRKVVAKNMVWYSVPLECRPKPVVFHSFSDFLTENQKRKRALVTQLSVVGDRGEDHDLTYIHTTLTNKETSGADQRLLEKHTLHQCNECNWILDT